MLFLSDNCVRHCKEDQDDRKEIVTNVSYPTPALKVPIIAPVNIIVKKIQTT